MEELPEFPSFKKTINLLCTFLCTCNIYRMFKCLQVYSKSRLFCIYETKIKLTINLQVGYACEKLFFLNLKIWPDGCDANYTNDQTESIHRLQRQSAVSQMAVPSKTCCINTSKQQVQLKWALNTKCSQADACQKILIWSYHQLDTHYQVSEE